MYAAGRPLGAGGEPPLTPTEGMRQEMRRLFALCRHGAGAQLLDFGAGRGRWARAALDAGFQVTAFEPSAPRSAADAAPYELVHSLDQLAGRRFDVVQLEQVLEHVADPLEVLHSVLRHCLPGAVVRITVPNVFRASRAGPLWAQWPYDGRSVHLLAPFEHLHGFSPMSLDRLLARAGLQPVGLAATLRHYPANLLRCLVGPWLPAVSSTLRLVAAPA
jgi:SAM-dependent methyltransferase